MMGFLISVLAFLAVLTPLVTFHELGHFLVARAFGVKIDRFSVGFGKALFSRVDRHGTEWRLGWAPIGGYVKFAGDVDASSVPDQAGLAELRQTVIAESGPGAERDYFHFKPVWQRALITVAGPAMNFVLAITLFAILYGVFGSTVALPKVQTVSAGSPAAAAGFRSGDLITRLEGQPVSDSRDVIRIVSLRADDALAFTVERAGRSVDLVATPQRITLDDPVSGKITIGRIGLAMASETRPVRYNPVQAVGKGFSTTGEILGSTLTYLGRIVSGKESGDQLSGPIGIATAAGGVTREAAAAAAGPGQVALNVVLTLIQLAAIVSIGMGFLNLLPIPVLDGGHLLFYGYEAVARRPVPARVQEYGYRVGLALLAGLMLFATWNDLHKLSLFKFLGGFA